VIIGSEKCELIALSPNSSRSKKFHDCSLQEKDTAKISKSGMATGECRRLRGARRPYQCTETILCIRGCFRHDPGSFYLYVIPWRRRTMTLTPDIELGYDFVYRSGTQEHPKVKAGRDWIAKEARQSISTD
jgi:hypothetical protein